MRTSEGRRVVILILLAAIVLGFVLGWFARVFVEPSLESRSREAVEELRTRARELTR